MKQNSEESLTISNELHHWNGLCWSWCDVALGAAWPHRPLFNYGSGLRTKVPSTRWKCLLCCCSKLSCNIHKMSRIKNKEWIIVKGYCIFLWVKKTSYIVFFRLLRQCLHNFFFCVKCSRSVLWQCGGTTYFGHINTVFTTRKKAGSLCFGENWLGKLSCALLILPHSLFLGY